MAKSILVYTDGEIIGDGIIKLPFVRALKKAFPESRITWLCNGPTVYAGLLAELAGGLIDEVVSLSLPRPKLKDIFCGPKLLDGRLFDIVIDTQSMIKRSLFLRLRLKHQAFVTSAAGYWLSSRRPRQEKPARVIDQLMLLGYLAAGKPLVAETVEIPQAYKTAAARLLPPGGRYVGFVPGAGQPHKCWPLERFISLAQWTAAQGFTPVVFLGPLEQDMAARFRQEVPQALLPLGQKLEGEAEKLSGHPCLTVALAQLLTAAVANDSGGGNLLAAGGAPLVMLYRSPSVRRKFMPGTPGSTALTPQDFGAEKMEGLPFGEVETALRKLLDL